MLPRWKRPNPVRLTVVPNHPYIPPHSPTLMLGNVGVCGGGFRCMPKIAILGNFISAGRSDNALCRSSSCARHGTARCVPTPKASGPPTWRTQTRDQGCAPGLPPEVQPRIRWLFLRNRPAEPCGAGGAPGSFTGRANRRDRAWVGLSRWDRAAGSWARRFPSSPWASAARCLC